jgi:hypothetical protein
MACPVCFGDVGPTMRESMNAGIFVLLGVTFAVLVCLARFFVLLARRARAASERSDATAAADPRAATP